MNLSSTDFLIELIEHALVTNRDEGLALWSNMFDKFIADWDISYCRRLLRVIKQSGTSDAESGVRAICLSAQGMLEIHLGHSGEAIDCYRKALAHLQKTNNGKETEAWIWSNLGNIYYHSGNFKDATESYSCSMELYREVGDEKGIALVLSNQGSVFRDSGELEKANKCYQEALTWLQAHEEGEYTAITLANLGRVFQVRRAWDEAEAAYHQALELFISLGNIHYQAQVLGNLGTLFLETNRLDAALDFFSRDLEVHQETGDLLGQSQTLNNLAIIYRRIQSLDQARGCYEGSLEIKREVGDQQGELSTLINYCYLLHEIGESEYLIKTILKARTLALSLNDEKHLSRIEALEREVLHR